LTVLNAVEIHGIEIFSVKKFSDHRGFFCETYTRRGHPDRDFVQDNISMSADAGTVRGLHYQAPPFPQGKLVTVLSGAIFDVAVDIRRSSPTFGRWFGLELTSERMNQILIPHGFAHGFCTLEPNTLVFYKADALYSSAHDRGILWNDPELGIAWPVGPQRAILSDKDRGLPRLCEIETPFDYRG
jgi:dTDP-4-dehydrorhamnose 3,5-epimerase